MQPIKAPAGAMTMAMNGFVQLARKAAIATAAAITRKEVFSGPVKSEERKKFFGFLTARKKKREDLLMLEANNFEAPALRSLIGMRAVRIPPPGRNQHGDSALVLFQQGALGAIGCFRPDRRAPEIQVGNFILRRAFFL